MFVGDSLVILWKLLDNKFVPKAIARSVFVFALLQLHSLLPETLSALRILTKVL